MLRLLSLMAMVSFLISSCQKERGFADEFLNNPPDDTPGNINLNGNWRFVGQSAHTGTVIEYNDFGEHNRLESEMDYISKNPVGTFNFTSNKMSINNVGYLLQGVVTMRTWLDGTLVSEMTDDVEEVIPPGSNNATFRKIGTDSLSFDGTPMNLPSYLDGPVMPNMKMGAKYYMSNDTLYMRFRFNEALEIPDPSMDGDLQLFGDIVIALKK